MGGDLLKRVSLEEKEGERLALILRQFLEAAPQGVLFLQGF